MCAMLESAGSFPNEGETEAWLAKKAPEEGDPEDEEKPHPAHPRKYED